jgi:siroheme synthase
MTVYLVGAGPGDPGLITVRGLELVRRCEVLVYDRLLAPKLVAEAPTDAVRVGRGGLPQRAINDLLVEFGRDGREVVRLKGGDPFVFGRGGEEALALAAAGVPYEVVAGRVVPERGAGGGGDPGDAPARLGAGDDRGGTLVQG